jgi:hypothetical protein
MQGFGEFLSLAANRYDFTFAKHFFNRVLHPKIRFHKTEVNSTKNTNDLTFFSSYYEFQEVFTWRLHVWLL